MNELKKGFVWFGMFCKRLLHKKSFIILLCLIPVIFPLANAVMSEESGILKVVLCNESGDTASGEIITLMKEQKGIIRFVECNSADKARRMVERNEADAAWIFPDNLINRFDEYTSKKSDEPIIKVLERAETVPLQLSREVLYGAMYEKLAYSLLKNTMHSLVVSEEEFSEEQLRRHYTTSEKLDDIVEVYRLNSDKEVKEINYLTIPLRGFLALVIMLCSMSSAMYFLTDNKEGRYDWIPVGRRLLPAFASCLSASVFSAVTVWLSLLVSGMSVGIFYELVSLLLFALSSAGFSLVLCVIFRSPGKLGATIPGLIIIMLALSPVFFNSNIFTPVRMMLPTHYYLNSVYKMEYLLYTLAYCVGVYALAIMLNSIMSKIRK